MSILAAHNDDDAPVDWVDVVEANGPSLRRLIAKRMANRELVDDALQETYLRAVRSCRVGRGTPDGLWLRTVARRASTDLYRGEPPPMADLDALVVAADGMLPGSDEHLDSVERRAALRWSLARLSPRHRRLLALRSVHDLTYQEIGAIENLSEEAVTAALSRARTRLRTHLYAYENRRSGAAAGLWLGYWLRKLRWRLQAMGPRAMDWASAACTVGVMAAMVAPVHAPAQKDPPVEALVGWTNVAYVHEVAAEAIVAAVRFPAEAATPSTVTAVSPADRPPAPRPLIAGHPDMRMTPDDTYVTYRLELGGPNNASAEVTVPVECTRNRTQRELCRLLGQVPGGS